MLNRHNFNRNAPPLPFDTIVAALEADLARLKAAFASNNMAFLVEQMDMYNDYSPYIAERLKYETMYLIPDSISWHAYFFAGKLQSAEHKAELLALHEDELYDNLKRHIYFCLSVICANSNDVGLFNWLMEQLENETDEDHRATILLKLPPLHKDETFNIKPIIALMHEGTEEESYAAIKALSNCSHPGIEQMLLKEFQITDNHTKGTICIPLESIGTAVSVRVLQAEYEKTKDEDLKVDIELVIQKIEEKYK